MNEQKPAFFILFLLISFASVNAVFFTPALPEIATVFHITEAKTQTTITWFLVGYSLGQLLYGPLANRYGRKPALYAGIVLQITSCFICIAAGWFNTFAFLEVGRFLLALGSGVGLKMTFTIINECYEAKQASQKLSYLLFGFALTPGLSIAIGGVLTEFYGWQSSFYAGALYGVLLLLLTGLLPETLQRRDPHALQWQHLLTSYGVQFKNKSLILGSLLFGCTTCFIYVFSALAPFIAIDLLGMSHSEYGLASIFPPIGLILGSFLSAQLIKKYSLTMVMQLGILITTVAVLCMLMISTIASTAFLSLFLPMLFIYLGTSLVVANATTQVMQQVVDKAHGSAVMNFINMSVSTFAVLMLGFFSITVMLLPVIFLIICVSMLFIKFYWTRNDSI